MAEMLWSLDEQRYIGDGALARLLADEVPGLDIAEAQRLGSLLAEECPRFLDEFLRLYHKLFLTSHFARAAMVAASRAVGPIRVLELADGLAPTRRAMETEALDSFFGHGPAATAARRLGQRRDRDRRDATLPRRRGRYPSHRGLDLPTGGRDRGGSVPLRPVCRRHIPRASRSTRCAGFGRAAPAVNGK